VPSLLGEGKMSKSVEGSYINLTDDLETIKGKLAKAPTDSGKGATPMHGVKALLEFVELFQGKFRREAYGKQYTNGEGIRYSDLKKELADAIYKELQPFQEKREYFENNPHIVNQIIQEGNEKASALAQETMREVKEKMGLL
jgi:tryptophanyl-tRNA synthetase